MSLLGDEKAAERKFKITGKYSGGIGSSGKWTPASQTEMGGRRFGNDWEAEETYRNNDAPQPTMTDRLTSAREKARLGAELPNVTVRIPGKTSLGDSLRGQAKAQVKEATSKQAKKAKSLLTPREESEKSRLEGLFTGGISHPAQAIPMIRAGQGMAGIVERIIKRSKQ